MKFHAKRYAVTAGLGALTVASMCNAATLSEAKWFLAVIGAFLVGLLAYTVVPCSQDGS